MYFFLKKVTVWITKSDNCCFSHCFWWQSSSLSWVMLIAKLAQTHLWQQTFDIRGCCTFSFALIESITGIIGSHMVFARLAGKHLCAGTNTQKNSHQREFVGVIFLIRGVYFCMGSLCGHIILIFGFYVGGAPKYLPSVDVYSIL